jgi:hypothetical protein
MFEKIQNPVLRRTVARVATLEKAAGMAGLPVSDLVNELRTAAGLPELQTEEDHRSGPAGAMIEQSPEWVRTGVVKHNINADAMLEEGEHPLNLVQKLLGELEVGDLIRIESSFPPIPLVDAVKKQGCSAWTGVRADGQYETYFSSGEQE